MSARIDDFVRLPSAADVLGDVILRAQTAGIGERHPCGCHACRVGRGEGAIGRAVFVVCPDCGNKRCPKASDHRHECTRSNEPGQPGSVYA